VLHHILEKEVYLSVQEMVQSWHRWHHWGELWCLPKNPHVL